MPRGLPTPDAPSAGEAAYRRDARRLRGRWAGRPARLQRELRDLARRHDAEWSPAPPALPRGTCGDFAAEVARRLDGPVLRHAQRRRLYATARRLGIGRFEANLVIAEVQHERGSVRPRDVPAPTPGWRVAPVALVIALESAIAWGAWLIFHA